MQHSQAGPSSDDTHTHEAPRDVHHENSDTRFQRDCPPPECQENQDTDMRPSMPSVQPTTEESQGHRSTTGLLTSGAPTIQPNLPDNPINKFPPSGPWKLEESHLIEPLHSLSRYRAGAGDSSQPHYFGFDKETGHTSSRSSSPSISCGPPETAPPRKSILLPPPPIGRLVESRARSNAETGVGDRSLLQLQQGAPRPIFDGEPTFRPLNILIADQHPEHRMVMERLLVKLRCRTISVPNGPDAVRHLMSETKFDIVFLDRQLAEIDGANVARMIRETPNTNSDTPVVAVVADLMKPQEPQEHHYFNALVEKPITYTHLIETMKVLCRWCPDHNGSIRNIGGNGESRWGAVYRILSKTPSSYQDTPPPRVLFPMPRRPDAQKIAPQSHPPQDFPGPLTLVPPSDSGYSPAQGYIKSSSQNGPRATLSSHVEEQQGEIMVDDSSNVTDDCNSVYTETSQVSDVRLEAYMTALVEDLSQKIGTLPEGSGVVEEVAAVLPRVLKAFSCKLGLQGSSQMQRDVMKFIRQNRRDMAKLFTSQHGAAVGDQEDIRKYKDPVSSELVTTWLGASAVDVEYEPLPEQRLPDEVQPEEDHEPSLPGLEAYRQMILTAPSYQWVLGQLRREVLLAKPAGSNGMEAIREAVMDAIPSKRHVSRKEVSQTVQVFFRVDCDLLASIRSQQYDEPAHEAIARAVVLTGSQREAQASSCQQYMDQTWPCTGLHTLKLVQRVLKNPQHTAEAFVEEPSGCQLTATLEDGKLIIDASGIPEFVAEIGEQVAWIGAAFQVSPYLNETITQCTTFAETRCVEEALHCYVGFRFQPCEEQPRASNGQCWHDMFLGAVIVAGFPILRRPETNTGLDMPLNLMTLLTGTRYLNKFNSKMYIKGFSAMLVPTRMASGVIYWHMFFKKRPKERISYLDCRVEHAMVQKAELETSRHVLGWCSDVVSTVGTLQANYSISKSQLGKTHAGCALDKVEINAGQLVTGTVCFSLGNREKPVHISKDGYGTKLESLSAKWVVFWDEGEKRGWLVNGTNALLHILRASFPHSKRKFGPGFLMNPQDLADMDNATGAYAALQFLMDEKNKRLLLRKESIDSDDAPDLDSDTGPAERFRYIRLKHQVEHIYDMLEKLFDHQADVEQRSGVKLKVRPRRQLEGWDFTDLAAKIDPIYARVATLKPVGKGWVDFIRSLHAVTLFGEGFGDLLRPRATNRGVTCLLWSTLPVDSYYLAARVTDLKEIMEYYGNARARPMKLCDGVFWHARESWLCDCVRAKRSVMVEHHDPVQALFPKKFRLFWMKKPRVELPDMGAVVFGHNWSMNWHRKDNVDPDSEEGDLPEENDESLSSTSGDSGIGSSP